jgi:hypothetical protein
MATIIQRHLGGTDIDIELTIKDQSIDVKFLGDVTYRDGDTLSLIFSGGVQYNPDTSTLETEVKL